MSAEISFLDSHGLAIKVSWRSLLGMIWNKNEIKIDFLLIDCNSPEWMVGLLYISWIPQHKRLSRQQQHNILSDNWSIYESKFRLPLSRQMNNLIIMQTFFHIIFIIIYDHKRVSWSKCRLCSMQFIMFTFVTQYTLRQCISLLILKKSSQKLFYGEINFKEWRQWTWIF